MELTEEVIKSNREVLTTALNSGEYKKNIGYLKSKSGRYCCLGLMCELAFTGKIQYDGPLKDWVYNIGDDGKKYKFRLSSNEHSATSYIGEIANYYGLSTDICGDLALRNDGVGLHHKHSFKEIAAHIPTIPIVIEQVVTR